MPTAATTRLLTIPLADPRRLSEKKVLPTEKKVSAPKIIQKSVKTIEPKFIQKTAESKGSAKKIYEKPAELKKEAAPRINGLKSEWISITLQRTILMKDESKKVKYPLRKQPLSRNSTNAPLVPIQHPAKTVPHKAQMTQSVTRARIAASEGKTQHNILIL